MMMMMKTIQSHSKPFWGLELWPNANGHPVVCCAHLKTFWIGIPIRTSQKPLPQNKNLCLLRSWWKMSLVGGGFWLLWHAAAALVIPGVASRAHFFFRVRGASTQVPCRIEGFSGLSSNFFSLRTCSVTMKEPWKLVMCPYRVVKWPNQDQSNNIFQFPNIFFAGNFWRLWRFFLV